MHSCPDCGGPADPVIGRFVLCKMKCSEQTVCPSADVVSDDRTYWLAVGTDDPIGADVSMPCSFIAFRSWCTLAKSYPKIKRMVKIAPNDDIDVIDEGTPTLILRRSGPDPRYRVLQKLRLP